MSPPVAAPATQPVYASPTQPAEQCAPASGPAREGQQAARGIKEGFEGVRGFPDHIPQSGTELAGIYRFGYEGMSSALERAKSDPEFAAAFFNELGPEITANLIGSYDAITSSGPMANDTFNITDEQGVQLLRDFADALGAASRSGEGCFDAPAFMSQMTGRASEEPRLDPELAAILVNEGEFTPEAAAELAAHVILNDDPPAIEPAEQYPDHRKTLLGEGAWPTALLGLMRNQGSSELLAIQGNPPGDPAQTPAARLMDPDLIRSSVVDGAPRVNETPVLVSAVLEQPIADLNDNPSDPAAIRAVESLMLGAGHFHGRVNEDGANALGRLYTKYAPEILNAGEGASAFPLARNTELGRYLADSEPLQSGDGTYVLTAGMNATGTPPIDPNAAVPPGPAGMHPRFESWSDAMMQTTAYYRARVEEHGPPQKAVPGGGTYPDLNMLAAEVSDIDSRYLQGLYGAEAIKAADVDDANQHTQNTINLMSDYIGFAVGLGTGGASRAFQATVYNSHVEGPILEHFFPTDNAQKVFSEVVPQHMQRMLAAQAVRIVDSAAQSGAIDLPASLRDPETGGLRAPEPGADSERFAADLADFIASDPAVHEAVDQARADLEEDINALDIGQYRGG